MIFRESLPSTIRNATDAAELVTAELARRIPDFPEATQIKVGDDCHTQQHGNLSLRVDFGDDPDMFGSWDLAVDDGEQQWDLSLFDGEQSLIVNSEDAVTVAQVADWSSQHLVS